jgi:hypothetical protein
MDLELADLDDVLVALCRLHGASIAVAAADPVTGA